MGMLQTWGGAWSSSVFPLCFHAGVRTFVDVQGGYRSSSAPCQQTTRTWQGVAANETLAALHTTQGYFLLWTEATVQSSPSWSGERGFNRAINEQLD